MNFTYPKAEHLKSRKAIEQLFKSGQSFFIYPYKVVYQLSIVSCQSLENDSKSAVGAGLAPAQNVEQQVNNSCQETETKPSYTEATSQQFFAFGHLQGAPLQSGFAVSSKNFKRAVDRNRIKRLGREAFRLNKYTLTLQLEASHQQLQVFFIFTDKKLSDYKLIEPKMQACLKKLGWLVRQIP